MFLKKITKTDTATSKQYHYYRLCECYRIGDKTRHCNLLNLGKLDDLDETERKLLADRICSEPHQQVREIYDALGYKYKPYKLKKFVFPETPNTSL